MADALDLGSSGRPCRFKSCHPHQQEPLAAGIICRQAVFLSHFPNGRKTTHVMQICRRFFQGEPYEEEKIREAIAELWDVMKKSNPQICGFEWADKDAPRFQLEPQGYRGYIEARPVRPISG